MRPFYELESTDLVEPRPFCFRIWHKYSLAPYCVADAELVLLVGFGADSHIEPVAVRASCFSIKDKRISLVLMGRDLIERPDQADASLDADNPACEWDLIHGSFENSSFRIVPRQVAWRHGVRFLKCRAVSSVDLDGLTSESQLDVGSLLDLEPIKVPETI
jgi:hypothetical protein